MVVAVLLLYSLFGPYSGKPRAPVSLWIVASPFGLWSQAFLRSGLRRLLESLLRPCPYNPTSRFILALILFLLITASLELSLRLLPFRLQPTRYQAFATGER